MTREVSSGPLIHPDAIVGKGNAWKSLRGAGRLEFSFEKDARDVTAITLRKAPARTLRTASYIECFLSDRFSD